MWFECVGVGRHPFETKLRLPNAHDRRSDALLRAYLPEAIYHWVPRPSRNAFVSRLLRRIPANGHHGILSYQPLVKCFASQEGS